MYKILFVCHGNICRSPMAEFVFKSMVEKADLADQFAIASAATSNEELGNPVHPGTRRILQAAGIDGYQSKRARRITRRDYEDFDLIIGMDAENLWSMDRLFSGDPNHKVHLLLEYAGKHRDVADPWYTGDFDATYRDVHEGCAALLDNLNHQA